MLLYEIHKLGEGGSNGNTAYDLLEVLDPAQNKEYEDHFIYDLPLDLSMFVTTANMEEKIYEPLRDRLEIILGGTVQTIGGLKEKLIDAHRAAMKIALIPKDNVPNLEDIPEVVLRELKIIPVSHITEVLDIALVKEPVKEEA